MPAPEVSNATLHAILGKPFTYAVQATNSPTAYRTDTLAPGVQLALTTGVISGIPNARGEYNCQVTASNAAGVGVGTIQIIVGSGVPIIPEQTLNVTVGETVHYQVRHDDTYPLTGWQAMDDLDPSNATGFGLTTNGIISGMARAARPAFVASIIAFNTAGNGFGYVHVTISPRGGGVAPTTAPVVADANASGTVGVDLAFDVGITGGAYTSLTSTGLPKGLTLSPTGHVSGKPTVAGSFPATVTATNGTGSSTGTITFAIDPGADDPTDDGEVSPNLVVEVDVVTGAARVVNGEAAAFYGEQRIIEAHFVPYKFTGNVTNVSFTLKEAGQVQQYQRLLSNLGATTDGKAFLFPVTTFANEPLWRSMLLLDDIEPSQAVTYDWQFFYQWNGRAGKSSILSFVVERPEDMDAGGAAVVDPGTPQPDPFVNTAGGDFEFRKDLRRPLGGTETDLDSLSTFGRTFGSVVAFVCNKNLTCYQFREFNDDGPGGGSPGSISRFRAVDFEQENTPTGYWVQIL